MSFKFDPVPLLVLLVIAFFISFFVGALGAGKGGIEAWTVLGNFGQYIEALVVTVTAVVVYRQYRRWREESSAHAFEGFKFIQEVFESEEFKRNSKILKSGKSVLMMDSEGGKVVQRTLSSSVPYILAQLDMIGFFTKKGFIDREVLLEYGGRRINEIGIDLDKHAADESSGGGEWITEAIKRRPRAEKLLNQAREYWSEKGID